MVDGFPSGKEGSQDGLRSQKSHPGESQAHGTPRGTDRSVRHNAFAVSRTGAKIPSEPILVRSRHVTRAWRCAVPLRRWTRSSRRWWYAVVQGISTPFNSGANEGRITDLELQKRIMTGRAGVPLLRHRVILMALLRRRHL